MMESQLPSQADGYVDRMGTFASAACALHCAVCALLPAAFGALGLSFLVGHETEWVLTGVAVSFGLVALVIGWRQHRKMLVFAMLTIGISGLLAARVMEGEGHHHGHDQHAEHAEHGQHAEHGEHGQHVEAKEHTEQVVAREGSGHHEEGDHDSHGQGFGEGLGIAAGLILMMGHITNLQEIRRATGAAGADACCDDAEA